MNPQRSAPSPPSNGHHHPPPQFEPWASSHAPAYADSAWGYSAFPHAQPYAQPELFAPAPFSPFFDYGAAAPPPANWAAPAAPNYGYRLDALPEAMGGLGLGPVAAPPPKPLSWADKVKSGAKDPGKGMKKLPIGGLRVKDPRPMASLAGSAASARHSGQAPQPLIPAEATALPQLPLHKPPPLIGNGWAPRPEHFNGHQHHHQAMFERRPDRYMEQQQAPFSGRGDPGRGRPPPSLEPPPPVEDTQFLAKLKAETNPVDLTLPTKAARFFVIKSYSEDDVHRSIKYGIWASTDHGNKRLDAAFREREGKGPIFLFFSVNASGHFCGVAQMMSAIDYDKQSAVWAQDKWKGLFKVKWLYVKDVPNAQLRSIKLDNNEGKPVTNSRDTQEVLGDKGKAVLRVIHVFRHTTSLFDDFAHYERRQIEDQRKVKADGE